MVDADVAAMGQFLGLPGGDVGFDIGQLAAPATMSIPGPMW